MFEGRLPIYLSDVTFKQDAKSEEKTRLVVVSLTIQPFTKELAEDYQPGLGRRIFRTDGGKVDGLLSESVAEHHSTQRVKWFKTPDHDKASMEFRDVEVGSLRIRSDKETPSYAASTTLTFALPAAKDLHDLVHGINTQFWLELQAEQAGLLDEPVDETPRVIKGRRSKAQAEAGATH